MIKPSHVYMDLNIVNNSADGNEVPLVFEETRLQPFLDGDSSDYYCTIVRFNIQTGDTLPVLIPAIDTNQSNRDQTLYQIKIEKYNPDGSYVFQTTNVQYIRSDLTTEVPSFVVGAPQDMTSGYYNIYHYQDFVDMVNATLKTMWVDNDPNPLPYMEFDPHTYKFIFNAPLQADIALTAGTRYKIYFNSRLYELFLGLPAIYKTGGWYQLNIKNRTTNLLTVTQTSAQYLQLFQEVCSVGMWNPVESIVFATTSLPIHPTATSAPKVYNDITKNTGVDYGSPNIAHILSDFSVPLSADNQYRPEISYNPTAEYRLIDMYSKHNLSRVDLQTYWKDKYGNLHLFYLQPGCSASVKILFRDKSW